jgi:hypothetical protein
LTQVDDIREEFAEFKAERNERLHKFFVKIMIVFAFLGFTTAATVYYTYTQSQNNRDALCAYRADLTSRVQQGEAFLKTHPEGFAGISAAQIRVTLDNQKKIIKVFKIVECP